MCLVSLLSGEEKKQLLKTFPSTFNCFRLVRDNGLSLYHDDRLLEEVDFPLLHSEEPCISPGTYVAENYPQNRSPIYYEPGFHVFKTKAKAFSYRNIALCSSITKVQKVKVSKSAITEVGITDSHFPLQVLVVKKITVE